MLEQEGAVEGGLFEVRFRDAAPLRAPPVAPPSARPPTCVRAQVDESLTALEAVLCYARSELPLQRHAYIRVRTASSFRSLPRMQHHQQQARTPQSVLLALRRT